MLRFFGNDVTPDMPSQLRVDVQGLQELYRLRDIDGYGQVAPSRLSTFVLMEETTTGDDTGDHAVGSEERST